LRNQKHLDGDICEAIVAAKLIARGYYVFRSHHGRGPVDIIAINDDGEILLLDVKKDKLRRNPGRKYASRINRVRSDAQKKLGVGFAYVDIDTEEIKIHVNFRERPDGKAKENDARQRALHRQR